MRSGVIARVSNALIALSEVKGFQTIVGAPIGTPDPETPEILGMWLSIVFSNKSKSIGPVGLNQMETSHDDFKIMTVQLIVLKQKCILTICQTSYTKTPRRKEVKLL